MTPAGTPLLLSTWVERERERIENTLLEWLRIPSISAQPARADDVRRSAQFTAELLADAGFENVTILETGGAPAVYADHLHATAAQGAVFHAPNERMVMAQFWKGLLAASELWRQLGGE